MRYTGKLAKNDGREARIKLDSGWHCTAPDDYRWIDHLDPDQAQAALVAIQDQFKGGMTAREATELHRCRSGYRRRSRGVKLSSPLAIAIERPLYSTQISQKKWLWRQPLRDGANCSCHAQKGKGERYRLEPEHHSPPSIWRDTCHESRSVSVVGDLPFKPTHHHPPQPKNLIRGYY